jgi:16S rRNA (adenine1518-N6/adenine1519-N6)-dimethyltransferase
MQKHFARKRFGQHFLHDVNMLQRIVKTINPQPNDHLVEIGPGLGALTQLILPIGATLDVVEIDRDLIAKLHNEFNKFINLSIYQADALKFDFTSLMKQQRLRIIGNLPYNISTPLLFHLLNHVTVIQDMHFMLQLEVAERIAAKPGTADYGRLSVMLQYYCQADILFHVAPQCFIPPPKVESAFIRLIPYTKPVYPVENVKLFEQLVREAFSQRRKMLHNSLKLLLSASEIESQGIDPNLRPEQLTVADFVKLSNFFTKKIRSS